MSHKYSVQVVWSEEDKAFLAAVPELPGCMADGETREQSLANLEVVVAEWLETAKSVGREIPPPMDRATQEKMFMEFRSGVQAQVQAEVEQAVQRVLEFSARFQTVVGHQNDPGDWWKRERIQRSS